MSVPKRVVDLCLAGMLGVVLAPLIAGIAMWLRCTQGAPVFYLSERMGQGDNPSPCGSSAVPPAEVRTTTARQARAPAKS